MAKNVLFEIGMEEIPARFIRSAVEQLESKVKNWLLEARIEYKQITGYATPRRIAILIDEISDKQQDLCEEIKGPSKKIAIDSNGEWSKAALGFARSQGTEPSELFFQELAGIEYVYAVKNSLGVETESILSESFIQIVSSMTFPKNMRWGKSEFKFVRPIRWICALYGTSLIQMKLAGVN